uniref:Uncharacterized protein n=1 Tax=Crocodylus porosus TaxID=8502 RepID=A0A7M4DXR4_CROPO
MHPPLPGQVEGGARRGSGGSMRSVPPPPAPAPGSSSWPDGRGCPRPGAPHGSHGSPGRLTGIARPQIWPRAQGKFSTTALQVLSNFCMVAILDPEFNLIFFLESPVIPSIFRNPLWSLCKSCLVTILLLHIAAHITRIIMVSSIYYT